MEGEVLSPRRRFLLAAGLVFFCGICPGRPALAAGEVPPGVSPQDWAQSRELFLRGARLYKEQKFAEAEEAFAEAHRLSGAPDLLFNLGRAAEKQGKYAEAADYLQRYLDARPRAPDRKKVQSDIERLRQAAEAAPPQPQPPRAEPPPQPEPVEAPPQPQPPRAEPPRQPQERRLLWPALGMTLGGAALLVAGIGVGAAAMAVAREINMTPEGSRFDPSRYQRGLALESAAIALDVVGAVGLLAGGAWTGVILYRDRAARRQVALSPFRMGLLLQGGF